MAFELIELLNMKVMRKLVHPNLVNLKDIFLEKNRLMLVMELMQVKTKVEYPMREFEGYKTLKQSGRGSD